MLRKIFLALLLVRGIAIPRLGYAYALIIPPAFATTVNPCPPEMAMIPGGIFTMGSDNSGFIEELPAYEDAVAYAQWAGKSLPTEAQWEYAARGGLNGATYAWGDQYSEKKANTWQGIFPFFNTKKDGYTGIAPVGSFPPNGYGLYDMTGNVWELTSDWFMPEHNHKNHSVNPTGPEQSFDPNKPTEKALHVIKSGSYLCAPNYCSRFRPAARESQSLDTGTTHIGFRLVKNLTTERMKNEV